MGQLNLLKGSYTGKVGQTVGATYKGKAVIKVLPRRTAPASNMQMASVNSFTLLLRVLNFLHTQYPAQFANPDRNLTWLNSLCSINKPLLLDHWITYGPIKFPPQEQLGTRYYQTGPAIPGNNWTIGWELTQADINAGYNRYRVLYFDATGKFLRQDLSNRNTPFAGTANMYQVNPPETRLLVGLGIKPGTPDSIGRAYLMCDAPGRFGAGAGDVLLAQKKLQDLEKIVAKKDKVSNRQKAVDDKAITN
jgi:hypothetical protein